MLRLVGSLCVTLAVLLYNFGEDAPVSGTTDDLIARIEAGERLSDTSLLKALRTPGCPVRLVSVLEGCRWVRGTRRVTALILRHPGCSLGFALDAVGRIGWAEMLAVARDPRAAPAVRRLAERRLLERVGEMSRGERTSLARRAPRSLFPVLIQDDCPRTIATLLDNSLFRETDALRLVNLTTRLDCVRVVLRHARWGRSLPVIDAVLRRRDLPLPVAVSIAVRLSDHQCAQLEGAPDTPPELRQALGRLRAHRTDRAARRPLTAR